MNRVAPAHKIVADNGTNAAFTASIDGLKLVMSMMKPAMMRNENRTVEMTFGNGNTVTISRDAEENKVSVVSKGTSKASTQVLPGNDIHTLNAITDRTIKSLI